jgi:hypothetical protein
VRSAINSTLARLSVEDAVQRLSLRRCETPDCLALSASSLAHVWRVELPSNPGERRHDGGDPAIQSPEAGRHHLREERLRDAAVLTGRRVFGDQQDNRVGRDRTVVFADNNGELSW